MRSTAFRQRSHQNVNDLGFTSSRRTEQHHSVSNKLRLIQLMNNTSIRHCIVTACYGLYSYWFIDFCLILFSRKDPVQIRFNHVNLDRVKIHAGMIKLLRYKQVCTDFTDLNTVRLNAIWSTLMNTISKNRMWRVFYWPEPLWDSKANDWLAAYLPPELISPSVGQHKWRHLAVYQGINQK